MIQASRPGLPPLHRACLLQVKFFEKRKICRRLIKLHKQLATQQGSAAQSIASAELRSEDSLQKAAKSAMSADSDAEDEAGALSVAELQSLIQQLEDDMRYVVYFPKDQKYISLFQKDPHDPATLARQKQARADIVSVLPLELPRRSSLLLMMMVL